MPSRRFSLLCAFLAFAHMNAFAVGKRRLDSEMPKTVILIQDSSIDANKVRQLVPGASVYTAADGVRINHEVSLDARAQKTLFESSGLAPYLIKMDHFDRDRLVRRLRYLSVRDLRRQYQNLPERNLQSAKTLLAKTTHL